MDQPSDAPGGGLIARGPAQQHVVAREALPQSGLDSLLDRTSQAPHELQALKQRLERIADHLEGPQPQAESHPGKPEMSHPNVIQRVAMLNDDLARGVRDLAEQIERLERIVGDG